METLELVAERCALCVVEMQNDIVHESNIGQRGIGGVLAEQRRGQGDPPLETAHVQIQGSRSIEVQVRGCHPLCGAPQSPLSASGAG